MGDYTLSMIFEYNSRPAPATFAYKRTGDMFAFALIKERETPEETLVFWYSIVRLRFK